MCGFVGFRSYKEFQALREFLPSAASSLRHRGPDDSGLFFDKHSGVGLGHRRLAVIDLSEAGRQPMSSEDGTVHIVYNGEVYNFKEIRQVLEVDGNRFQSSTDTEVILMAYLKWGIECLQKFIGMFSLAIWDRRKHCLYLARDRLGIKPLYYHFKDGTLLFASELKAIMKFRSFDRSIDSDAIPLFLHYQYVPAPKTIFADTYKLLPGHYMVYDGQSLETKTFWSVPEGPTESDQSHLIERESLEKLEGLLTQVWERP